MFTSAARSPPTILQRPPLTTTIRFVHRLEQWLAGKRAELASAGTSASEISSDYPAENRQAASSCKKHLAPCGRSFLRRGIHLSRTFTSRTRPRELCRGPRVRETTRCSVRRSFSSSEGDDVISSSKSATHSSWFFALGVSLAGIVAALLVLMPQGAGKGARRLSRPDRVASDERSVHQWARDVAGAGSFYHPVPAICALHCCRVKREPDGSLRRKVR
jgi:hypothetical protein